MAGLSPKTAVRAGAALPLLLLGLLSLPGCGDSYPEDLTYPLRTDPLVIKVPDSANQLDPIGQLEQWIDSIPVRGGQVLDPRAAVEKSQLAKVNEYLSKSRFDLSDEQVKEIGISQPADKDDAKAKLEARRDKLKGRIETIEKTMKTANPQLAEVLDGLFGKPARPKVKLTADVLGNRSSSGKEWVSVPDEWLEKKALPRLGQRLGLTSPTDRRNNRLSGIEKKLLEKVKSADSPTWDEVEPLLREASGLRLDPEELAKGSVLYRRHCLHCHGLTGDGRGPTAPWVNPHPRDYRQGKFKFTSSSQPDSVRKPRRDDLLRTLRQGIEGTSMPSFALLDEEQLQQLASYVIHLSLRGQAEFDVLSELLKEDASDVNVEEEVWKSLKRNFLSWAAAQDSAITVGSPGPGADHPGRQRGPAEFESIRHGYELFTTTCIKCHNDFGRANNYSYDEWGTIVRPANLTAGIYRGGRRPLDLYYRIHSGIGPAKMTSFADSLIERYELTDRGLVALRSSLHARGVGDQEVDRLIEKLAPIKGGAGKEFTADDFRSKQLANVFDEDEQKRFGDLVVQAAHVHDEIWDIVNFLEAMPYKNMLPEDVSRRIYVDSQE